MLCKHDLVVGTCATCNRGPGRGMKAVQLTELRPTYCQFCHVRIELWSYFVWYLHKPAHQHCLVSVGNPDPAIERTESRWNELRKDVS